MPLSHPAPILSTLYRDTFPYRANSSTPQWPAERLTSWRTNPLLVKTPRQPTGVDWPVFVRTTRPVRTPRDPKTLWRASATIRLPAIRRLLSHPSPWSRTHQARSQLPKLREVEEKQKRRNKGKDVKAETRTTGDGDGAKVQVKAVTARRSEGTSLGAHGERRNPVPKSRRSGTTGAPCPVGRARSFQGATGALLQIKPTIIVHPVRSAGGGFRRMTTFPLQDLPIPTHAALHQTVTIAGTFTVPPHLVATVTLHHTVAALPRHRTTGDLHLPRGFLVTTPSLHHTGDTVALLHHDADPALLGGERGVAILPHAVE